MVVSGSAVNLTPGFYSVGTLRYNQRQLVVLFLWLMWNDFSLMLMEQITGLNSVLMKDHGATFTQIAVLGSIGGFVSPWINPWISTWSDRHRGRHGRRRPFLFCSTPFFAAFLMAIPFMPDFYHRLVRIHFLKELFAHLPMSGEAMFIGVCGLVAGLFNASVLAIFSYLYWDVVPDSLMGRFQSLSKTVALAAGLVWNFLILGQAENHAKMVYVGTAVFCLLIYMTSVWQIKEGEYPPPDPHEKGGAFAPVRAYFVECFSQPYYLWVFVASFLYQLGGLSYWYQFNYAHYDLKLDLGTVGWCQGWATSATTGFGLLFGFVIGSLTDRLRPMRLTGPCYFLLSLVMLGSWFFVTDKWSYLGWFLARSVLLFIIGVVIGAFTVGIFPREKLGQFCSAQAVFYQVIVNALSPFIAMFFDRVHNNRLSFLWAAVCNLLCAAAYVKVYMNWKERKGLTLVPHAG